MKLRLNRTFIPWIIFHFFEYWYLYLGAFLCLYFLHNISSELPLLAKNLGDILISGDLSKISISQFFIIALGIIFFRTFSRLLFFYPARLQQRNLRMEMVEELERSYPENYKNYNDGQIFQRLYDDLNRIRGFVGFALLQIGNIIIASFVFIPKINSFKPDFLIAFTPMILSVFIFAFLIYFFQPYIKKSNEKMEDVQNFIIESYSAKKTIQNYHSENIFTAKLVDLSQIEMKYFFLHALGKSISFPIVKIGVGLSLVWGAYIVKINAYPVSDLIYFSSFIFLILEPFLYVSWIGVVLSHGYVAWERIKNLMKDLNRKIDFSEYKDKDFSDFKIKFWKKEIELNLNRKKWTVLIGDTGCGKSYCLERISEFLKVNKKSFSFIQQEPYLYNDSLINNIFLGQKISPSLEKKALFYLKEFGLDILADNDEELLKLEIGENGKRVSGGQAKRIALIRSIISDVEYIIWDDPFSSVDLILESQIIKRLKKDELLKDKTFIFSSHRLSTVRQCDQVILLDKEDGIQEAGEVSKLLANGYRVNEFFQKQLA